LVRNLLGKVKAAARCAALLVCTDGFSAYVKETRQVFREAERTGKAGRPRLIPWPNLMIGQVIKQYAQRRVVGVIRRLAPGSEAAAQVLITQTQGGGGINTAYIERRNATFRERWAGLVRRGRALVRQGATLYYGMYLVGAVYNFCTDHHSLRLPGGVGEPKWVPRTPAMAAGITDHRWTVAELLWHRVPPPRWTPPKRRGRRSAALQRLIARWCPSSTI
jgi:IS1 family transposase